MFLVQFCRNYLGSLVLNIYRMYIIGHMVVLNNYSAGKLRLPKYIFVQTINDYLMGETLNLNFGPYTSYSWDDCWNPNAPQSM